MKRAKCKLCNNIVEIKNRIDMFSCPCGEITIDYITAHMHASLKTDKSNLLFVDEDDNEIVPASWTTEQIIIDRKVEEMGEDVNLGSRRELLSMIDALIHNIDSMPNQGRFAPVTHSDFAELLSLVAALFRSS